MKLGSGVGVGDGFPVGAGIGKRLGAGVGVNVKSMVNTGPSTWKK